MFGEDGTIFNKIMEFTPDYIIEKFERYVESTRIEYPWGLHPSLRDYRFHNYIEKWKLDL